MAGNFRHVLLLSTLMFGFTIAGCDKPEEKSASTAPPRADGPAIGAAADLPVSADDTMEGIDTARSGIDQDDPAPGISAAGDAASSDVPPPSRAVFTDEACDYERWIGQPLDEGAVKATGRKYRLLTPDAIVTMDHDPSRLNVVEDGGKVTRVWCG